MVQPFKTKLIFLKEKVNPFRFSDLHRPARSADFSVLHLIVWRVVLMSGIYFNQLQSFQVINKKLPENERSRHLKFLQQGWKFALKHVRRFHGGHFSFDISFCSKRKVCQCQAFACTLFILISLKHSVIVCIVIC